LKETPDNQEELDSDMKRANTETNDNELGQVDQPYESELKKSQTDPRYAKKSRKIELVEAKPSHQNQVENTENDQEEPEI
jgi:hypothetical protein